MTNIAQEVPLRSRANKANNAMKDYSAKVKKQSLRNRVAVLHNYCRNNLQNMKLVN